MSLLCLNRIPHKGKGSSPSPKQQPQRPHRRQGSSKVQSRTLPSKHHPHTPQGVGERDIGRKGGVLLTWCASGQASDPVGSWFPEARVAAWVAAPVPMVVPARSPASQMPQGC